MREQVEARYTSATVEIFLRGQPVAACAPSDRRGHHSTIHAHMPPNHRVATTEWNPQRLIEWAPLRCDPRSGGPLLGLPVDRPHATKHKDDFRVLDFDPEKEYDKQFESQREFLLGNVQFELPHRIP